MKFSRMYFYLIVADIEFFGFRTQVLCTFWRKVNGNICD